MATVGSFDTPLGNDRRALATFVSEVEELLGGTLANPATWFPVDLQEPLQSAWEELAPSFAMAPRYLAEPPDANLLEAQLVHVGLTGRQLALKRTGWERARDSFRARVTKRALSRALRWANIILGSLAGLIPGADAIKEYKEAVEQAVEDENDESDADTGRPPTRGEFKL
jgi:hypothetical protein